jgi:hypothetical protein
MKSKYLQLLLLVITLNIYGQSPDSILTGSYLNSSPNKNFTLYNYSVVKPLGFNTVIQRAVVNIPEINQGYNFDSLKYFPYIFALNDSVIDTVFHPSNTDWVYYFSNALYSRWIPNDTIIPDLNSETGLKQKFGENTMGGVTTGTDTSNINKIFIDGPNHSQYRNYVYTNKYLTNDLINYTAVFKLKNLQNTGPGDTVCKVQAVATRSFDTTVLAEKTVTKNMLGTDYTDVSLNYNYGTLASEPGGRGDLPLPPTTIIPASSLEDSYISEGTRIQLRVIWLGNAELAIKEVEVFDNKLWKHYFVDYREERNFLLTEYLAKLRKLQPGMKNLITMVEPRSVDSYHPIITLLTILNRLGAPPEMIAGFYPGRQNDNRVNKFSNWLSVRSLQKVSVR